MRFPCSDADVVIIGGGPIGLANGLGMQMLNPALKIVVVEKYQEYQRKHTLIMKHQNLAEYMQATGTENHPVLKPLLKRLRKDPHIRTSELEQIFKKLAVENGVVIHHEPVTENNIHDIIYDGQPPKLIIGADGTHSTVSRCLFGPDNQVKHEFDYVLQLRFEVNGEHRAKSMNAIKSFQDMARQGIITNEYVGAFDAETGKTPITLQLMISKEEYEQLRQATSQKPLKPFSEDPKAKEHNEKIKLPRKLATYCNHYLLNKIISESANKHYIDRESIRISVNEAPATHAKRVVGKYRNVSVSLNGDAALGLSYFKGLNAGFKATAKYLSMLRASILNGFNDAEAMQNTLERYEAWFLNDFAPKKVNEVAKYSTWNIRSFMKLMVGMRSIKEASVIYQDDIFDHEIEKFFDYIPTAQASSEKSEANLRRFPHRAYDPVTRGDLNYIPIQYTLKKTVKLFIDYVKPYKANYQAEENFKQPLSGANNLLIGILKLLYGFFTLSPKRFFDGVFTAIRGAIEIATTPLAWTLKPITRLTVTYFAGQPKIESNSGIKKLSRDGINYLKEIPNDAPLSSEQIYRLLALCSDIHRKFHKSLKRGQQSNLLLQEHTEFATAREIRSKEQCLKYFSLFAKRPLDSKDLVTSQHHSQLSFLSS